MKEEMGGVTSGTSQLLEQKRLPECFLQERWGQELNTNIEESHTPSPRQDSVCSVARQVPQRRPHTWQRAQPEPALRESCTWEELVVRGHRRGRWA